MREKNNKMKKRDIHMIVAAMLVCALQGCSGCGEKPEPKAADPVVERMADKEYVEQIEKSIDEQRLLAKSASETMARLAKAEEAGASAGELASISNELKKCYEQMELSRAKAQMMVRERMLRNMETKKTEVK